jgi:uncharacterized damage-inducible protein DinB
MKEYFLKLFKYNEWANNRILEAMLTDTFDDDETIKLFSHILTVQITWLDRLLNKNSDYDLWKSYNLEGCITISKESSTGWIRFIEKLGDGDLQKIIQYTTTKGIPDECRLDDIFIQVITHSTYHRAQIAKQLRSLGIDPPGTDYILYLKDEG